MNLNDEKKINELKTSNKKILIYGNMHCAEAMYYELENHGVSNMTYAVDKAYYTKGMKLGGTEVLCIEEIPDLSNYNVVIGFNNIEKTRALLSLAPILPFQVFHLISPVALFDWDESYIKENTQNFEIVKQKLADEKSRLILDALIKTQISGDYNDLLPFAEDSQYFNELTYCIDPQNEVFVDCGAYNGDTILKYSKFTEGRYKKIIAFEPMADNAAELKKRASGLHNVEIINKATWNENTDISFISNTSASAYVEDGDQRVEGISIDEVVGDEKVTYIKMDVEGSEYNTILGAKITIERCLPKLAISVYHKKNDIIELFNLVDSLHNKKGIYKYFLRHHSNRLSETVMYAIPVMKGD